MLAEGKSFSSETSLVSESKLLSMRRYNIYRLNKFMKSPLISFFASQLEMYILYALNNEK